MSTTTAARSRATASAVKPSLVSFDLAHWVGHLKKIANIWGDGGEECIYSEFAWDLTRTLGWRKYWELKEKLGKHFAGIDSIYPPADFDDNGACWSHYKWNSHADEDALLDVYALLGWEQSILFCHWDLRERNAFDDHAGHIPPRVPWCGERDCPVHPRGGDEVVELPHGTYCPDHVQPEAPATVSAEATPEPESAQQRSTVLREQLAAARADGRAARRARRTGSAQGGLL